MLLGEFLTQLKTTLAKSPYTPIINREMLCVKNEQDEQDEQDETYYPITKEVPMSITELSGTVTFPTTHETHGTHTFDLNFLKITKTPNAIATLTATDTTTVNLCFQGFETDDRIEISLPLEDIQVVLEKLEEIL